MLHNCITQSDLQILNRHIRDMSSPEGTMFKVADEKFNCIARVLVEEGVLKSQPTVISAIVDAKKYVKSKNIVAVISIGNAAVKSGEKKYTLGPGDILSIPENWRIRGTAVMFQAMQSPPRLSPQKNLAGMPKDILAELDKYVSPTAYKDYTKALGYAPNKPGHKQTQGLEVTEPVEFDGIEYIRIYNLYDNEKHGPELILYDDVVDDEIVAYWKHGKIKSVTVYGDNGEIRDHWFKNNKMYKSKLYLVKDGKKIPSSISYFSERFINGEKMLVYTKRIRGEITEYFRKGYLYKTITGGKVRKENRKRLDILPSDEDAIARLVLLPHIPIVDGEPICEGCSGYYKKIILQKNCTEGCLDRIRDDYMQRMYYE